MANSTDPNEYTVQTDADIENDLERYNVDIAATLFEAVELEKVMEDSDATGANSDAGNKKGNLVKFGDGKANRLIVMQKATMEIPSGELDEKKKKAIKDRAKKSKEKAEAEKGEDNEQNKEDR